MAAGVGFLRESELSDIFSQISKEEEEKRMRYEVSIEFCMQ